MSPEDQKYFDTYFDLFSSDGWKQLIEDLNQLEDTARNSMCDLSDEQSMFVRKGNIQIYSYINNLPILIEHNYKAQTEEDKWGEDNSDL